MEDIAIAHGRRRFDVSVVVPAFRAAGFIHRAIESALDQEGVKVEVVVVDDACPAGTADAVERRYGLRDDVTVLRLPSNRGPAAARNAGIVASQGYWVAVLDADDIFEEGRLARGVAQGDELGADVFADNIRYFDPVSGVTSEPRIRSISRPTQLDVYALVAGARPGTSELDFGLLKPMFRRSYLTVSGNRYPETMRHGEDFSFYVELLRAGARFFVVPQPGYVWTVRNSGQSQTVVDYLSQVRDVRALQQKEWVRTDARLYRLLDARASALTRLHQTRTFAMTLKQRRYGRAATACLRHPHLMVWSLRVISGKLRAN